MGDDRSEDEPFTPRDAFEAWLDAQWIDALDALADTAHPVARARLQERRETIECVREQYVMMRPSITPVLRLNGSPVVMCQAGCGAFAKMEDT